MLEAVIGLNAASIIAIKAHDYEHVVTRTVITLDSPVVPDVQSNPQQKTIRISLPGVSVGGIRPDYRRLRSIIDAIEVSPTASGTIIIIKTMEPFRTEQLILPDPHRIVLDIHAQLARNGRRERLALARFYTDTGKYSNAEREFRSLTRDFANDHEIAFNWGYLLIKRKSFEFANEKLSSIPSSSPLYARVQSLSHMIPGAHPSPEKTPSPELVPDEREAEPVAAEQPPPPQPQTRVSHSGIEQDGLISRLAEVTYENIILSLLTFIIMMFLLTWIWMLELAKRIKPQLLNGNDDTERPIFIDTDTRKKMVSKLLSDGWSVREIARELKISAKEVEQTVKLCQMSNHDEHN